jgi:hypothetical protein
MHYRLVSLWDLLMQEFDSAKFLGAYTLLVTLSSGIRNRQETQDALLDPGAEGNAVFLEQARSLHAQLQELGLSLSAVSAQRVLGCVERGESLGDLHKRITELHVRLGDELKVRVLLIIPAENDALYRQGKPLFGPDVAQKFGRQGSFEIEEAGKCLALGRSTACAFHLMRAVECGLHAVRRSLNLPEPIRGGDKTWGAILGAIGTELERRENLVNFLWLSLDDKRLFHQMHASAALIKEWRDPTMHLESKYIEEEARHLFALTKGFMQKVASRIDEDGHPPAQ